MTFCRYLTNQYRFEYNEIAPCCWITKQGSLDDEVETKKYIDWLHQIDDWVPECARCKEQEDRGFKSHRTRAAQTPGAFGFSEDDPVGKITTLEFQMDAECNAACLICSEGNSTTWKKYNTHADKDFKIQIDEENKRAVERRLGIIRNTVEFDNIKKVNFLGGEPLRSDLHLTILNEIKSVKNLDTVYVTYVTNGSTKPSQETVALWREAKRVQISVSVDGIDEHFNYFRWPLQWKQVKENIKYILDLDLPNLNLTFSYCVTPFSIFYHERYKAWADEFFKDYDRTRANTIFELPFEAGGIINMGCVPPGLAQAVIEKYRDKPLNGFTPVQYIHDLLRPFNRKDYTAFMNYIELHDVKRRLNWREIFPEIAQYFPEKLKQRIINIKGENT